LKELKMNATVTTTITAKEIQQGIEHIALVIAQWDAAVEDETVATDADVAEAQERVAKMFEEINAIAPKAAKPATGRKMSSVEASMPAWMLTGRTTNGTFNGRGSEPAAQKAAEPAIEAEPVEVYTHMLCPGEHRPFIHEVAETDMPQFGLKAEQAYYLVRSESMSRCNELSTYWIVTWSYEECRWLCPCLATIHQCKHVKLVNQDCHNRKLAGEQQQAA
jgi:hypothetical protein